MLSSRKKILLFLFIISSFVTNATSFFVSSTLGSDTNNGLSSQTPIQTIEKLNTFNFNPGDSILFKSGDIWEGMFWLKGSGIATNPIVIDTYGGNIKASINGNGYQSCLLIYNDDNITINNLNLYNENSHLDSLVI